MNGLFGKFILWSNDNYKSLILLYVIIIRINLIMISVLTNIYNILQRTNILKQYFYSVLP